MKETGCCKPFDPKPWDNKAITFTNKLFVRDHVISFLHIPLNINAVMGRSMALIKSAGAEPRVPFMLFDENSLFGSDAYIEVSKPVPGAKMVRMSGTFLTKVFEGGYDKMGAWIKTMHNFAEAKGKKIKKLYFFYTMCPACAKAYGQNYTVLVARV
jgi:hypothetical protein